MERKSPQEKRSWNKTVSPFGWQSSNELRSVPMKRWDLK
jgi:hypothetical protein